MNRRVQWQVELKPSDSEEFFLSCRAQSIAALIANIVKSSADSCPQ